MENWTSVAFHDSQSRINQNGNPLFISVKEKTGSASYTRKDGCLHLICLISFCVPGENNTVFVPESTRTTYELVKEAHPNQEYDWIQIPDYTHFDLILGKNAVYDVYPHVLRALDRHAYDNLHLSEAKLARISQEAMAMRSISGKVRIFVYAIGLHAVQFGNS